MSRHLADEIERIGGVDCEGQPDLFFPEDFADLQTRHLATRTAKALCASCPLQKLCLDTALAKQETWGIWGGMTADERSILRRQLKSAGIGLPRLD